MKLRTLKERDDIRLKESIQGTLGDTDAIEADMDRTPGQDQTAMWIEEHISDLGGWPLSATEIEAELNEDENYTGPDSRQHITNVLENYYEGADSDGGQGQSTTRNTQASQSGGPDRSVGRDNSPFTASPESIDPQQRPQLAAGEQYLVAFVEDGRVERVVDVPIPDDIDDLETYIQGVLAGVGSL